MSTGLKLRAEGERRVYMREGGEFDTLFRMLNSSNENIVVLTLLRSVNKDGYLRLDQEGIAKKLDVSRSVISKVFRKAKKAGVLLNVGRRWYVNPYVALPYGLRDIDCNRLQQMWTQMIRLAEDKGKVTMEQALLIHESIFGPNYDSVTGEMR